MTATPVGVAGNPVEGSALVTVARVGDLFGEAPSRVTPPRAVADKAAGEETIAATRAVMAIAVLLVGERGREATARALLVAGSLAAPIGVAMRAVLSAATHGETATAVRAAMIVGTCPAMTVVTPVGTAVVTPVGTAVVTPVGTAVVTPVGTAVVTPVGTAVVTPVGTTVVTPVGTTVVTPVGTTVDEVNLVADRTVVRASMTALGAIDSKAVASIAALGIGPIAEATVAETPALPIRSAVHAETPAAPAAGAEPTMAVIEIVGNVETVVAVTIVGFREIGEAVIAQSANRLGPAWRGAPMNLNWRKVWICARCRSQSGPSFAG